MIGEQVHPQPGRLDGAGKQKGGSSCPLCNDCAGLFEGLSLRRSAFSECP